MKMIAILVILLTVVTTGNAECAATQYTPPNNPGIPDIGTPDNAISVSFCSYLFC